MLLPSCSVLATTLPDTKRNATVKEGVGEQGLESVWPSVLIKDFSWRKDDAAVEAVRRAAGRAASALQQAGVSYVVVGGNAVASWVARVDQEAVRNTKDVDVLDSDGRISTAFLPRCDLSASSIAMLRASICFWMGRRLGSYAIHLVFSGEGAPDDSLPIPDVTECVDGPDFPVPTLDSLVRMKLTSFRLKNKIRSFGHARCRPDRRGVVRSASPRTRARLKELATSPDREI